MMTMSPRLSSTAQTLTGSTVVEARRKADELAARGIDIVDFGIGEPDFAAPDVATEAAIRSLRDGKGQYVDPSGLPALREAIAEFERNRNRHCVDPNQVVVTTGSYGALTITARALLDVGDEVLLPEPFWGPYRSIVHLVGAIPVPVPSEVVGGRFTFDTRALRASVTPRTRAIVINTPNNPTGRVLSRSELSAIAQIALEHDLWIIADEVYGQLVFDGARHESVATLSSEVAARTVVATSLSKTFAMTGWRLGYCLAPAVVAEVLARINQYNVRCPTSFVQYAAAATINNAWDDLERMRRAYQSRRDLVVRRLARLPGVRTEVPEGTFYAFPRIPDDWGTGKAFADRLLNEAGIVVSGGNAYGASAAQHFRISFATSEAQLNEGFDRIDRLLDIPTLGAPHHGESQL
jgi:aspartate/methionine/tyrosine aminotransferase